MATFTIAPNCLHKIPVTFSVTFALHSAFLMLQCYIKKLQCYSIVTINVTPKFVLYKGFNVFCYIVTLILNRLYELGRTGRIIRPVPPDAYAYIRAREKMLQKNVADARGPYKYTRLCARARGNFREVTKCEKR